MTAIYIVHMSDLHINQSGLAEINPMTDALSKRMADFRLKRAIAHLDILIVSGDLVHQGSNCYKRVKTCLDKIQLASGIDVKHVFMVPGNHDVDRTSCHASLYKPIIDALVKDPEKIQESEKDKNEREILSAPFKRYRSFAESYPLLKGQAFPLPGFAQADLSIDGLPIRLCGLNTALVAGPGDNGKSHDELRNRCGGFSHLSAMLDNSEGRLNLVVSHYPLSWIHERERTKTRQLLQQKKAVLLTGHVHEETAEASGLTHTQLLQLGAGTSYGGMWGGRNHCRIIELSVEQENAILHDWIWFGGELAWRGFEPLEAQCPGWAECRHLLKRTGSPDRRELCAKAENVGLVDIRNNRSDGERLRHYEDILANVELGSELLVVGRSLKDWARYHTTLQDVINTKGIHVKLGLLDINSLFASKPGSYEPESWIEQPIPGDWAINDLADSMNRFRHIRLTADCKGTLKVYGLPFYVSHSFVAYTNAHDKKRHCAEEVGMALPRGARPFLEVRNRTDSPLPTTPQPETYSDALETMYSSMLTQDRLLLSVVGNNQCTENDTARRTQLIGPRLQKLGLVDLTIDRHTADWRTGGIQGVLDQINEGGEIFMVGRSLVILGEHKLGEAVIQKIKEKHLRCNLVLADPTRATLSSLVKDDYAMPDLRNMWRQLRPKLEARLTNPEPGGGYLEIFGIPAFIPTSFASFSIGTRGRVLRYCCLEPGIGVVPADRPFMYFREVGTPDLARLGSTNPKDYAGDDIYNKLNKIYRSLIHEETISPQTRLLFSSRRPFKSVRPPFQSNAVRDRDQTTSRGWFIGHFADKVDELCHTSDLEVKWGVHQKGDKRETSGVSESATTLTLLISGSFEVRFPKPAAPVTLTQSGDYVIYPPGVEHTWEAIDDCVVLTIRWPSVAPDPDRVSSA
jgi:calcineurin-like phosphoesterase family protein